ncbi:MAG: hypothetical protein Q4C83_03460 [Candidatus Saccharibacteria bacterium]|nr:hypothetical protein [Candidatus Saccharibacteria bacterium]
MADYPDWVLKHKTKGTYINKVGDKYYLYAAHSERVPGTKKVKRVFDGYLGRITKEQGLIPPKDPFPESFFTYEFGLSSLILTLCANIHKGFRRSFVVYGDFIMAASILSYIYGCYSLELFQHSWLSLRFPQLQFPPSLTSQQVNGISRGVRMIADTMQHTFGEDLNQVKASFSLITLVSSNKKLHCCQLPASVEAFVKQYSFDWSSDLWQK